ncbi:MAG: proline dehydrogenase family protein [Bacteroidota bacterium]|nr:proline dehydrogenase family protein [Bacteroidota bacterium]
MHLLNKFIVTTIPVIPRPIVRFFASRYIAGEELLDAVNTVKTLNTNRMMATMDVLGEAITKREGAELATNQAILTLEAITKEKLDSNLSIKLTQLGLELDKNFCLENTRKIVQKAKELNIFVRIDMEDSSCTDATIDIYTTLRKEYPNVGIALQAYLRRTEADVIKLMDQGYMNFRLCKGIYVEPESIAYKKKQEISDNFNRVLETMFRHKAYVGIATHDEALVEHAYRLVKDMNLQQNEYEFQMLLGVRSELRSQIVNNGHRLRVYVPYGHHWYKYSIRRFKENPEIAGYVFKSIFSKNNFNIRINN